MNRRSVAAVIAVALCAAACSGSVAGREDLPAVAPSPEAARGPDDEDTDHAASRYEAQLETVRAHLDAPLRADESLAAADAVRAGTLELRGEGTVDVTGGVPWAGWEASTTTSQLRILHGLLIVHDLVETGRPEDLALADEIVADWVDRNPRDRPAHDMAWHDETTARRTTALIRLHDAHETAEAWAEPAWREQLETQLRAHLELLLDDDFHATGNNHGMFQDRAALLAAAYLELRGLGSELTDEGWRTASERLLAYYHASVTADGVHREHAPAYHQLIAAAARRDAELLRAFDDHERAGELSIIHEEMVTYATHVIQPDGTWPLVSDTFTRGTPRAKLWDDDGYLFAATGGTEGHPPTRTAVAFEEAGYVIARDGWSEDGSGTYLHFTAAYHGDYHKHADDLSLWLYHDGPLLTELGPQGYTMSDPLVQCAYSDAAHNIARVDGLELPRTDDRVGSTGLVAADVDGPVVTATGANARLDGVRFERDVTYDRAAQVVEVVDRVRADTDRAVRVRWHLDPSVSASVRDGRLTLARDGHDDVVATFRAEVPLDVEVHGPDPERCTGLRFGGPEPVPTSTVEITTPPRRETEVVARFVLP